MQQSFSTMAEQMLLRKAEEDHNAMVATVFEQLRESVVHKDTFFSVVSHELRTPLNGIIGLSEAILRNPYQHGGEISEKHLTYIGTIAASGHHLVDM